MFIKNLVPRDSPPLPPNLLNFPKQMTSKLYLKHFLFAIANQHSSGITVDGLVSISENLFEQIKVGKIQPEHF